MKYLIMLLSLVYLSRLACAQEITPWSSEFENPLRSGIDARVIEKLSLTIGISDAQKQAFEFAIRDHQKRFAEFVGKSKPIVAKQNQRVESLPGNSVAHLNAELEREKELSAIANDQAALDQQALESIRALLSDDQQLSWPKFLQRFHRSQWLGRSYMYLEERPDLIQIVDQIAVDDPSIKNRVDVQEAMISYASSLDVELCGLVKRVVAYSRESYANRGWIIEGNHWYIAGTAPGEKTDESVLVEAKIKSHREIRQINRESAAVVESMLPEPLRREFRAKYFMMALQGEALNSRLIAGGPFIEEVLRVDSLNEEQRGAIDALKAQFLSDVETTNRPILSAQAAEVESRFDHSSDQRRQELRADYQKSIERRYDLERRTVESVWGLLNADQQSSLHKPEFGPIPAPN